MKDIPGYEGRYAITEYGDIWSHPKLRNGRHAGKFKKVAIVSGYLGTTLLKDKTNRFCRVNRLVAITYIPNPDNLPIVLHNDNDPFNNHVSNLRWGTQQDNIRQAHAEGRCPVTDKMRKARSKNGLKLSKKIMQFTKDGILCKTYDSTQEAMRITGITQSNISSCATGKRRFAGGFVWRYV